MAEAEKREKGLGGDRRMDRGFGTGREVNVAPRI